MSRISDIIRQELDLEAKAILRTAENLDADSVEGAFGLIMSCRGKVVLTGMGKTGIIARKISATLASTGTNSIFLHAAEGIHGDLGMLSADDVVIAISNSGSTAELLSIIPYIKFMQIPLIALTGNPESPLAQHADCVLDCSVPLEYEPFGLVPTASTTVALALGDALAIALLREKGFTATDFARFHPGGTIGKRLLLRVSDLMHSGEALPVVSEDTIMSEVIMEMTSKKLGCTAVIDHKGILTGIITDGDLRRHLQEKQHRIMDCSASQCMTHDPKASTPDELAVNAINLMETYKITMLPVVDKQHRPVGMLHMHDMIRAGVI
ncbi:MAG: KpsF/GutQ family sugar-phosphate isomerase [Candidatus Cloacimonetes bacterium]|nr:KpsF/GutQ family sugar-phosphate isomerase [Candidatus Cloacimonadota bacterium]